MPIINVYKNVLLISVLTLLLLVLQAVFSKNNSFLRQIRPGAFQNVQNISIQQRYKMKIHVLKIAFLSIWISFAHTFAQLSLLKMRFFVQMNAVLNLVLLMKKYVKKNAISAQIQHI